MKNLPTDLQILNYIYDTYYKQFIEFSKDNPTRSASIFVPIDIEMIANNFGVHVDIIFGRLYYHLEKKYGYQNKNGTGVPFFALKVGSDKYCINFPYMASVLANLRDKEEKDKLTTSRSTWALLIAAISVIVSIIYYVLNIIYFKFNHSMDNR
jgi:hypothetical protein